VTTYTYELQGINTNVQKNSAITTNSYAYYDSSSRLFSIIKLCQATTLIALILAGLLSVVLFLNFFDGFRDKLIFSVGATVLRNTIVFLGLLMLAAIVVAFLALMGVSQAFSSDSPSCTSGPCQKFTDTESTNLGTTTISGVSNYLSRDISWGPDAGWYLVLACIPLSLLFVIIVALNKYPIPIDSIGTGEAL